MAVGLGVAQVLAYLLNVFAARRLGPDQFGAFAALLGITLIGNTVALGVQAVAARTLTHSSESDAPSQAHTLLAFAWRAGLVVAAAFVVLVPLLTSLLRLDGPAGALLVAASLVPLTANGGQLGVAQGREAFTRLALLYALMGFTKSVGGIGGVVAFGTAAGTTLGFGLGSLVGALVSIGVVRALTDRRGLPVEGIRSQTAHAANSLLALFALTNVDVLLARHFLPASDAGTYAVGSLVAKVAFFAPTFVTVIAFPRMARAGGGRTALLAAAATAAVGVLVTGITAAASHAVVAVMGGPQYEALAPQVALFAALGSMYALAQVLLYSRLAVDDRLAVVAVWTAVGTLVAAVWIGPHDSVAVIVTTALVVAGALVAVGLVVDVLALRGGSHSQHTTEAAIVPPAQ